VREKKKSLHLNFGKIEAFLQKICFDEFSDACRPENLQKLTTLRRQGGATNACLCPIPWARSYEQKTSVYNKICRVSPMSFLKANNSNLSIDHMFFQLINFRCRAVFDVP